MANKRQRTEDSPPAGHHQGASSSRGPTTAPTLTTPRNPRMRPAAAEAAIPPPYPWAQDRRCMVHTRTFLHAQKIFYISGNVHCHKCDATYLMDYNLEEAFDEVTDFVYENVAEMCHRAHKEWMDPVLLDCEMCEERKSVGPVISDEKRRINWLFLLLGQNLGFCTVNQLRYFCKHTGNYVTGAKDGILFRVYLELCRQVNPFENFYF